jgi:hypothetical protein
MMPRAVRVPEAELRVARLRSPGCDLDTELARNVEIAFPDITEVAAVGIGVGKERQQFDAIVEIPGTHDSQTRVWNRVG